MEKRRAVAKLLIEMDADPSTVDDEGLTAFDHAAASGVTGLEEVLRGGKSSSEIPACWPAHGHRPALLGLSLGMTHEEVGARLPGFSLPPPDSRGLSYVAVTTGGSITLPPDYRGVRLLRLAFLDGRLAYVHAAYDPTSADRSFNAHLSAVSAALVLTGRWRRASPLTGHDNAHSMSCDGLTAVAGRLKLSYVELHASGAL